MEKKILKKRQSASQETKELSEQGAEKSNSGLITAGMLLYSKTELSEAGADCFWLNQWMQKQERLQPWD